MKYVVKRTDGQYLRPARAYWSKVRFRQSDPANIDETQWTADINKARVFGSRIGAIGAWKNTHPHTIVGVTLAEVPGP